jgi:hypothetical protein
MKKRDKRTDPELQQDSKTVLYEFQTLYQIATNLHRESSNALIESFGIHCRALTHFLFGHDKPLSPTDVLARDYFHDVQNGWEHSCPKILEDAKTRANKQIAHITTERRGLDQSPDQKVWEIREVLHSLSEAMEQFLNVVPKTRLADGVEVQLRELVQKALKETDHESGHIPLGALTGPSAMTFSCLVTAIPEDSLPD